ncbi:TPA: cobyrinic acid a,c-diamide synthase [Candidatus Bathyarchaeota archaeon]|nr:cobyrinic acid a,c-diamide synthase [Candidatus Bathyarchaeota archaeon]
MKVAISGKGGVGKTFLASSLALYFLRRGLKVLAIDADPTPNLAVNLGVPFNEARRIIPISENLELIRSKTETGVPGVYRLSFDVKDVVENYSIKTPSGVNLVVMGAVRFAGEGCTCPANALLRALLRHMLTKRDEVVIIDMEAGTEHLGRGTAKHVDSMLIVADANLKSLETASKIHELSSSMGVKKVFIVGNKVSNELEERAITRFCLNRAIPLLGVIPYDERVFEAEVRGEPLSIHAPNLKSFQAIGKIGEKLVVP